MKFRTSRRLLGAVVALVLACAALVTAHAASATSQLPFTITNNSGRADSTFIYVMARGTGNGQQGYVDGSGTWRAFALPTSVPSGIPNPPAPDVSIAGPGNGASMTFSLPDGLAGARIYISFGSRLTFNLSPGGLVEPAPWNPNDPNVNVLYDWAELARVNGAIFINTTQVDFFSVPMAVSVTGPNGVTETQGQYNAGGRDGVLNAFKGLGGDWAKLIYSRPSDGLPLRVYAPTHGIHADPRLFSSTYLDPYISGVWNYYSSHALTIDTASGTFVGRVSGDTLKFTNSSGAVVANLPHPTTDEVFGCSGATQPTANQPNLTYALMLGAQVCAALHRGTLSTPDRVANDHQPVLDANAFYKAPQTDLYSKTIHDNMVNGKAYGFAYDDVSDFSPSINQPNPVSARLTLTAFAGGSTGSTGGNGGTTTVTGNVIAGPGGKCADVGGVDNAGNGGVVQLWDCESGAVDQHWTASAGSLKTLGRCLDVVNNGTGNGSLLQLWDCNGGGAQQWVAQADGSLKNPQSGRCIDAPNGATGNGTRLQIWDCNASGAQKFSISGGTGATGTTTGGGSSAGGLSATSILQAEAANAQSGTQTEATSDSGGGQNVGYISNGDWLRFDNVNFGSAGLHTFSARVASGAGGSVSGIVEVHLDAASNLSIGSFAMGDTGGWQSWRTVPGAISTTTGTHTVFVKFVTSAGTDFANVNWLTFS